MFRNLCELYVKGLVDIKFVFIPCCYNPKLTTAVIYIKFIISLKLGCIHLPALVFIQGCTE
jgi:hypothetical protein